MAPAINVEPPLKANADLRAPLPQWYPAWARQMADLYYSGTTSLFVLWGNVHDPVRCVRRSAPTIRFATWPIFLASQVFGRWDLVIGYDLGRGLRPQAASDADRLRAMWRNI